MMKKQAGGALQGDERKFRQGFEGHMCEQNSGTRAKQA